MEKQSRFQLSIPMVGLITVIILMVPLVAMQFTDEVRWSVADFIVMGALLFGTGMLLLLVLRQSAHIAYRAAMGLAIGATLFMIWANLAVGLIGSGPNPGNLMYIAVVAILLIGIYLSRFKIAALERVMFITAVSLVMLAIIALLANMHQYPGSSVMEIIGVNLFFATPYIVAGLLLRYLSLQSHQTNQ
jgi:hypothetical protein